MANSDLDDDLFEDMEDEGDGDEAEGEVEEENIVDVAAEDATEPDDEDPSDDSDDGSDDDDEDEEAATELSGDPLAEVLAAEMANAIPSRSSSEPQSSHSTKAPSPVPLARRRSPSPASIRRNNLRLRATPRTFTIEAICALPHPVPTHALAASHCMTHLLTGSDDGYIRDYDIFTALNGKNFLTAPQRHHSGVVEGIMKAAQIRFWWENPYPLTPGIEIERALAPVYSLAMQSDALWTLAGTDTGPINLFTVRHEPGRVCHTLLGHRGAVSSMSVDHDEKGVFSAGWDGEAIQWDLNTGQNVRKFTAHGSQLTYIAVRPTDAVYTETGSPISVNPELDELVGDNIHSQPSTNPTSQIDMDAKSDASHDSLFDEDDANESNQTTSGAATTSILKASASQRSAVPVPKGAPPLLDTDRYKTFSPDILMTVAIDGQIMLWDKRVHSPGQGVGRLGLSDKTPPWCLSACWSADGSQIYAGRRNGAVEVYDMRQIGRTGPFGTPRLLKTLRNPQSSGVVSCVVALPDNRHIACASIDNIRLWNVADAVEADTSGRTRIQFKIIPGHHGGYISQMVVDPGARFLVSSSSNRGWHGDSTKTVFVHDIKHIR